MSNGNSEKRKTPDFVKMQEYLGDGAFLQVNEGKYGPYVRISKKVGNEYPAVILQPHQAKALLEHLPKAIEALG